MLEAKKVGYYIVQGHGKDKDFGFIREEDWNEFKTNMGKAIKESGPITMQYIKEAPFFVSIAVDPENGDILKSGIYNSVDFQVTFSQQIGNILCREGEDVAFDNHLLSREELERVLEFLSLHDTIYFGAIFTKQEGLTDAYYKNVFTTVSPEVPTPLRR